MRLTSRLLALVLLLAIAAFTNLVSPISQADDEGFLLVEESSACKDGCWSEYEYCMGGEILLTRESVQRTSERARPSANRSIAHNSGHVEVGRAGSRASMTLEEGSGEAKSDTSSQDIGFACQSDLAGFFLATAGM